MALELRKVFDKHRIQWWDKGPNTAKGQISISCPWCNKTSNKDPSHHLLISSIGEYYCYRNPAHKGMNLGRLFSILNIPYAGEKFTQTPRAEKVLDKDFSQMQFFQPAEDDPEALAYLESRLFLRPAESCKKFKLLTSKEGVWAGRLLIPLTIGWTGRAMRPHLELRYDAYTTEDGFFLFKQGSTSCLIVEGAIDGMRLVSVSSQFDVIGKCKIKISPAILAYLREQRYISIYNIPDGTVPFSQSFEETRLLRSYCTYSTVKRVQLLKKDFGIMPESDTREWLTQIGS